MCSTPMGVEFLLMNPFLNIKLLRSLVAPEFTNGIFYIKDLIFEPRSQL